MDALSGNASGSLVTPNPTRRFSDRVEYYVRSRPKYPSALLEFCQQNLGLLSDHHIADIGSGTGILSELFVNAGYAVFAVEPNAEMRGAAEAAVGSAANFHSIDATAESTGLPGGLIYLVVAGQAFHWFNPREARAEFERILVPGGWVALIWNERRIEPGFSADYEQIVQEFETDLKHVSHQHLTATGSDVLSKFFAPSGYSVATFDNSQPLDLEGVLARAMSSSYLPRKGQPRCDEMLGRLREVYDRHQAAGLVCQPYDTQVFYGRMV
ncbi:MAG: class I SAM-dependent methyltransferase [Planctomycetota bacterium]|nr:class I SAM-dependent methyltransferase [Planctomycetota bacterium]